VISLRPARDDDRGLLFEVYASTRTEELAAVPWSDEQKRVFLQQQFDAQDADYRSRRQDAQFFVIEVDGAPAGRLYRSYLDEDPPRELRIMDIALLPDFRGRGIGSSLLDDLMAEADAAGLVLSLHVEKWNPARRLYDRLGFVATGENDVYLRLERPPGAGRGGGSEG
jgi:ribosomal protein S18 acetylase RimI-like enzyme